jgi:threonine dehydrogenase-like Zn-dependent dehydrogenase
VSRGTELLVYAGRVPPSEYARMRAPHQSGEFPWPVKYGYANVGIVKEGPSELLGRTVLCLYPHQTAYVVAANAVVPVPEEVPPGRAVLGPNMETALNVLWDAGVKAGDRVAVIGAGVVGASVAYLAARHPGTDVELVDVDPSKARVAAAHGVRFASPADARPEADVVIDASGVPGGLLTALSLTGQEATVVEASWFGDRDVTLPLGAAFHSRRLRIQSSQVGQLPPSQRARWTHRRRLETALALLADPALDVLVSGESPFEELPEAMERFAAGEPALCHRIAYG